MAFYQNTNPVIDSYCTGKSNTSTVTELSLDKNVVIDYLKIRFNQPFAPDSKKFEKLLTLLKVDTQNFDVNLIMCANCKSSFTYDASINFFNLNEIAKNMFGDFICIMEMKGQTCREFEMRGGDWLSLFKEILFIGGECIRIDLTLDDFTGEIDKRSLLDKIYKHEYVSSFKNRPEIIVNNGFTITFGKYSKKTLCIYDKMLERQQKNIPVFVDSWMRYECRFKDNQGHDVFVRTIVALENNSLDVLVKQLLRGLLEFKAKNNLDASDLDKAKVWSKWENFLDEAERIKITNQSNVEKSITRSCIWLSDRTTRIRIIAELLDPKTYIEFDGYNVINHINKITNSDIAQLNYLRSDLDLDPITLEQAREYLNNMYNKYSTPSGYMSHILELNKKEQLERSKKREKINRDLEGLVVNYETNSK